jgi:subtilase family serine protease
LAAVTVTLPEVPRGRYYLIPYADCDDVLVEVDNGNNATQRLCLDIGSSPDYAVTNLTCKPTTGLGPGTALEVEVQTTNVGDAPAPPKGSTHTALFWSTDKAWDEADLRLGDGGLLPPLSEGAGRSQRFTVKAPDGVGPGTYYLIALANLEKTVPEPDEKNNCFAVAVVVGPVR